ncbi:zinc-binding dehydrogenase [Zhengella sp.]|uniref:MDR/zinc-dependent alcohol dehydrogenase-like family protein n=1 Tax=Zhengella sp. TaxID=2282762 RepID=UPI003528A022
MEMTLHAPHLSRKAETMQAAVLTAPRQLRLEEVPLPPVRDGQIRVRLEGCGVCASNLTPWQGADWMQYPTGPGALGHEGWGIVESVAPDVARFSPGDRVATLFENSYAEYDAGDADAAVHLPPSLDGMPFPGEPIGCAMNIFRRSDIRPGQWVAIIGAGFLGNLLARLASHAGAQVIAISRRGFALETARRCGAHATIGLEDRGAIAGRVAELTDGALCERVIEATGKPEPLALAGEIVSEGGRLVIAGYHQDAPRLINMQQWNWKGIDVINAHERQLATCRQGVIEGIQRAETGLLPIDELLTHSFPLALLDKALDITHMRPEGFMKALVTFDQ